MSELCSQLQAIDVTVSEEDQVMTLLGSLPKSYSSLVTALESRTEQLTIEYVQQALLNEEQRRSDSNGDAVAPSHSERSLTVKHQKKTSSFHGHGSHGEKYKKKMSHGTQGIRCHACGGIGHVKRNCPSRSVGAGAARYDAGCVSVQSHDTQSTSANMDFMFGAIALESRSDTDMYMVDWIVDSGAPSHMTNDLKNLIEYKPFQSLKRLCATVHHSIWMV
jgi:hypothetical protein